MATINIEQIASEIRRVDGDCAGIMDDFQCIKGFCGKLSDVLTDTSAFAIPADLKNIFTPILADFVLYIFNCRKRNMKIIDVQLEGSIRGFEEFVLHCKNTEPDVEDLFVNEANNELNSAVEGAENSGRDHVVAKDRQHLREDGHGRERHADDLFHMERRPNRRVAVPSQGRDNLHSLHQAQAGAQETCSRRKYCRSYSYYLERFISEGHRF